MKFVEMFAGIGGMSYGLESAGMECVGFAEWDKFAHKAYNILHNADGRKEAWTDVTKVTERDLLELKERSGGIDVLAGGFPCQAFSVAGKRKGFEDTRGTLFFECARWASILRPTTLLFENVKGLLNHNGGETFEVIISALDELGYDAEWQVLNSKKFGVPHNRERIFIVGHLRESSRREVFPIGKRKTTIIGNGQLIDLNPNPNFTEVSRCLTARYTAGVTNHKGTNSGVILKIKEATKQGYAIATEGDSINFSQPNSQTRRGRVGKGIANTLETNINQGTMVGYRIRKLTPLECFRLQSFPDEWYHTLVEHGFSNSQLYKMAGNAVTSKVAEAIGRRLMK